MEKGSNKDWLDAVREQCLSDGTSPAPGSWEAVGTKMRRAAARRHAALAAAVVVPAAALLLWAPWRQPTNAAGGVPQMADSSVGVPAESPASLRSESFAAPVLPPDHNQSFPGRVPSPASTPSPAGQTPSFAGLTGESPVPSSKTTPDEDKVPENTLPSSNEPLIEDGGRTLLAVNDPAPRHRPRIASVSVRAGSATVRRNAPISMASAPYLAALNFINTTDPSLMPRVKSNASNTRGIGAAANAFFPESSAGQYTHDLPLSLGLSLRVDLTPKIGLETGLEYTYLHSMEEFAGSRLNQRLHFIGIPVRLDATLWTNGAFGIYAGLGGKVEKCVSATLGKVACEEPRLQWSAEAFGGIQYQLGPRAQIYFQPALSYYFTQTDLPTYRTEHPLGVTLHAGLRFDL